MARSFVAFGAGGRVAAPRVFPLSLEQLRAARRFAIRRTVDAVVRHPLRLRGILRRGWILWGAIILFQGWGLPLRPWGSPVRVFRDILCYSRLYGQFDAARAVSRRFGSDSSMLVAR